VNFRPTHNRKLEISICPGAPASIRKKKLLSSVLGGLGSACKLPYNVGNLMKMMPPQEALLFLSEHRTRQADESEEHTSVES
jgi:hypothetical protein